MNTNNQSMGSADDKAHVSPSASPAKASPTAGGVTAPGVPSASKYTSGPWRTKRGMDQMCDSGATVASIVDAPNGPRWWIFSDAENHGDAEADARLIAAAPSLLSALKAVRDADVDGLAHIDIDAVIEIAEGK